MTTNSESNSFFSDNDIYESINLEDYLNSEFLSKEDLKKLGFSDKEIENYNEVKRAQITDKIIQEITNLNNGAGSNATGSSSNPNPNSNTNSNAKDSSSESDSNSSGDSNAKDSSSESDSNNGAGSDSNATDSSSESDSNSNPNSKYENIQKMPDNDLTENQIFSFAKKILLNAYNVIEDQRIESNLSILQQGSKAQFQNTNKRLGNSQYFKISDIQNPVDALLATRQGKKDLVLQTRFSNCCEYIDLVECMNEKFSIELWLRFIEKVLKPYFKNLKNEIMFMKYNKKSDPNWITIKQNSLDDFEKSYLTSLVQIYETFSGKKIDLIFGNQGDNPHYVYQEKKDHFKIVIDPHDELIDRITATKHEICHVFFNSSFKFVFRKAEEIARSISKEVIKQ